MSDITDGMITVVEFSRTTELSIEIIIKLIHIGTLIGTYEDGQWYVRSVELQSIDSHILNRLISEEKEPKKKNSPDSKEPSGSGCLGIFGIGFLISVASGVSDVVVDKIGKFVRKSDYSITKNYHYSHSDYNSSGVIRSKKISQVDPSDYHGSKRKNELTSNENRFVKNINGHSLIDANNTTSIGFDNLNIDERAYLAEQTKHTVNHFIVIPDDRAIYKNIFTHDSEKKELNRIIEIKTNLDEANNTYIANQENGQIQVKNFISHTDSEYLTFTGHNDKGNLILPNGDKIQLNKISELCLEFRKRCVFLSCKSKSYIKSKKSVGVNSDLTYSDASKLIHAINKKSQFTDDEISYLEFSIYISEQLDKALSTVQYKSRAIFYVKRGGKLAGVGGISYKTNEFLSDEKSNR